METTLTEQIKHRLISGLKNVDNKLFWNYDDYLPIEVVKKAIKDSKEYGQPIKWSVSDYLYDRCSDSIYEKEIDMLKEVIESNEAFILEELGLNKEDELKTDEVAREWREEMLDYLGVNIDLETLAKRSSINIVVSMYSNYDCINSWGLESQGIFSMESYFGDMIRMLKLNPEKIKSILKEKGYECDDSFEKADDKDALVTYESFYQELTNMSCGANLLVFLARINVRDFITSDLYNKDVRSQFTIPKGNTCGMFSSMQGGGSVLEMELQKDFSIELGKQYDKSGFLNFNYSIEEDRDKYSIKSVYGCSDDVFGEELRINIIEEEVEDEK